MTPQQKAEEWVDNNYPNGISTELELGREPATKGFLAGHASALQMREEEIENMSAEYCAFLVRRGVDPKEAFNRADEYEAGAKALLKKLREKGESDG